MREHRALLLPRLDVLLDLPPSLLANHRAEEGRRVGGVADLHHAAHEVDHLLHQVVVRLARDEDARRHGTALTGVEEGRRRGLRRDDVEVVGVEEDGHRLAAELEVHALQGRGGGGQDLLPGRDAAREAHLVDARVRDQRLGHGVRLAGDEVHDAGRQVRLGDDLGEQEVDERAVGRRLEDHRAAGGERRAELLDRDEEREVPGGDEAADARRLAVDDRRADDGAEGAVRHAHGERLLEVEGEGQLGIVAEQADRLLELDVVRQVGRPGLGDEHLAEILLASLHAVGDRGQDPRPVVTARPRPRPLVEGAARRGDRAAHVVDRRVRRRADRLLGGGVRHAVGGAAGGIHPASVDQHLVGGGEDTRLLHGGFPPRPRL